MNKTSMKYLSKKLNNHTKGVDFLTPKDYFLHFIYLLLFLILENSEEIERFATNMAKTGKKTNKSSVNDPCLQALHRKKFERKVN